MRWRFAMGADRRHVVDIPPAAGQQPEILLPPDPLSDRLHRHSSTLRAYPVVPAKAGTHHSASLRWWESFRRIMPSPERCASGKVGPGFRRDDGIGYRVRRICLLEAP